MSEIIIENKLILYLAQGGYFVFTLILSIWFLCRYKVRLKLMTGLIMLFWTLLTIKDFIFQLIYGSMSVDAINWIMMFDQFAIPFGTMYCLEVLNPHSVSPRRAILLLLPFIILLILYAIAPSYTILNVVVVFSALYAIGLAITYFYCRKRAEKNNQRIAFLVCCSFILLGCVWVFTCIKPSIIGDLFYYVISILFWAIVCFVVEYISDDNKQPIKQIELSGLEDKISSEVLSHPFEQMLKHAMERDKLYLNPSITISDLARHIGTNRSYLSEYFNNKCSTTFTDYINALRLQYAEQLMAQSHKISFEEIASNSGFNSLSTFRRAFVKKHGITPSNYRHKLKEFL